MELYRKVAGLKSSAGCGIVSIRLEQAPVPVGNAIKASAEDGSPPTLRRKWLVLALFCLPFFVALDDSSVWDANEAFYVQTPREMLQRDSWLVPYFNGEPRLNKPPLSYWLVAGAYALFGVGLGAERLVIALLACGSVAMVFQMGRRLFNEGTALLAVGIFATSFRVLMLSRRLLIDILLLLCITAAAAFFVRWLQTRKSSDFLLTCLAIGLGFLAKGPVVALIVLAMVSYLAWTRQLRLLKESPWLTGLLLTGGVSCSWFVLLALRHGPQPVIDFFVRENLGRFSSLDFGPRRGPFYYLGVFFTEFAPWSLFFPGALIWWLKRRSSLKPASDSHRWLLLWMGVFLVAFSFSLNKQEYYILPIYPAAALWIASYLNRNGERGLERWAAAILTAASGIVIGAITWIAFGPGPEQLIPSLFLAAAAWMFIRARHQWAALGLTLFYAAAFWSYLPSLEDYKPVRPMAERILEETAGRPSDSYQVGYYRLTAPSLAFYLNRRIEELYDPSEAVAFLSSNRPSYLLIKGGDLLIVEARLAKAPRIVEVRPKLYTTARNLGRILISGGAEPSEWTRSVYLVTNDGGD